MVLLRQLCPVSKNYESYSHTLRRRLRHTIQRRSELGHRVEDHLRGRRDAGRDLAWTMVSFAYRRTSHRAYGEKLHLHTYAVVAVVAVGLEKLVWKKIENTN